MAEVTDNPSLEDVLDPVGGKFFTVTFLTAKNEERVMNCRKGCKIGVVGTGGTYTSEQVRVYDVKIRQWRSFLKSRVISIRFKGEHKFK